MKKLVVYLCLGAMVFSLGACGDGSEAGNESSQQTVESSVESSATESQPAGDVTVESGATTESEAAGDEGMMDVTAGWSEEMEGVKAAVVEAVGADNYWPNMAMDAEILEMMIGIIPDMYDDYLAEMPMISTNVDTLLIIKAKDDKVEAVEEVLNNYRDMKVNDTMQYPMNVGKTQASRVETFGNYVCFVQLGGDTSVTVESGDDAVVEQCQKANELAVEAISKQLQ